MMVAASAMEPADASDVDATIGVVELGADGADDTDGVDTTSGVSVVATPSAALASSPSW